MTYGKLRQFRRDRLYASDRDRIGGLIEMLKKSRVADDQQSCATCYNAAQLGGSPNNKTNQGKNWDHGHSTKGASAQKISPTKQQATASKYNDSSHYNNGQVMTQISAIYAKRSRSILNQFGQTNIGAHVHVNHVTHAHHAPAHPVANASNNHLSPN